MVQVKTESMKNHSVSDEKVTV